MCQYVTCSRQEMHETDNHRHCSSLSTVSHLILKNKIYTQMYYLVLEKMNSYIVLCLQICGLIQHCDDFKLFRITCHAAFYGKNITRQEPWAYGIYSCTPTSSLPFLVPQAPSSTWNKNMLTGLMALLSSHTTTSIEKNKQVKESSELEVIHKAIFKNTIHIGINF